MEKNSKIYVAGHRGLVGSAIIRHLEKQGYTNLIVRTSAELDLRNQVAVNHFFKEEQPEYVFLCAAKVGGILANVKYPADFIYENLMIESNVIHAAYKNKVKKLLFMGSTCIYPKMALQPIKEEYLLTGPLEITNEPYAVAKIAGVELCKAYREQYGCDFISCMPTNIYGIGDSFDYENSHVMPSLIRKFYEAKRDGKSEVVVWGTGTPRREFLNVEDLADATIHLMNYYSAPLQVNMGVGEDIELNEVFEIVKQVSGFQGEIVHDLDKPDGTPRKLLDVSLLLSTGWSPKVSLEDGVKELYKWYEENADSETTRNIH